MGALETLGWSLAVVFLAGCDPDIQITTTGAGGGGALASVTAANGSTSTIATSGKTTSVTSGQTTSTGAGSTPEEVCDDYCVVGCVFDMTTCHDKCSYLQHVPACADRAAAYLACYIEHYDKLACHPDVDACDMLRKQLETCIGTHSCVGNGFEATQNGDECEYLTDCTNGDQLEVLCEGPAPDVTCDCYLSWSIVGTCTETTLQCGLPPGCCAQFYAL